MEAAAEVVHHGGELGRVGQLDGVGQHQHATGFQQPIALVDHVLAGLAGQLVQQEHAGDPLHAGFGEGHRLAIALHQLGQLAGQLREPAVGLAQVGRGEVEAHQLGLGQGATQLAQGAAGAGGHIQHPDLGGRVVREGLEAAQQGCQYPPAHRIGCAVEQDLHLQVVEGGGVVAQVAVGLVMEVLQVVVGVGALVHIPRQVPHVALAAAVPDGGHVQPHQRVTAGPVQPGGVEQQRRRIQALFRLLPVPLLQGLHGLPQIGQQLVGHGLKAGAALGRQQLHQLAAHLLVGDAEQRLALLEGLVRQLGELISHGAAVGRAHFSRSRPQPRDQEL